MTEEELLAERFEADRVHLSAVAYRMLGSTAEAEDAVQEAWLRLQRSDTNDVNNLSGWLTTVTARVCLDMLRSRTARREDPLDPHVPDPVITRAESHGAVDPEQEAVLADSVGLALLVVLEMLDPAERLAFVLHDMFAMPFDEIAPIVNRTPAAARQLASRARRRVQDGAAIGDADIARQREVVDAFFDATRRGDFDALVAVLDPDVVLRADGGTLRPQASGVRRGAVEVATGASRFGHMASFVRPALVNGAAGAVVIPDDGELFSVMGFTVAHGKVVAIDILSDPERLRELDLSGLDA
jgi:RNA polymerase sigma factor (sigma-70 family)